MGILSTEMNGGQCFKSLPSMDQTLPENTYRESPTATHDDTDGPVSSCGAAPP